MKKLLLVLSLLSLQSIQALATEVSFEEDRSLPMVYLNVALKTGASADPEGQSGLSNFMGEMLLRGTKLRSKEQIDLALDQMGARLEVETRSEFMILRGAVLASQLQPFLNLVKEIVTQPSFPEAEIRKLKSEIVSGILEELGRDSSLARRKFDEFLFKGHPYGKPILGKVKDVQNLKPSEIAQQYNRQVRDKYLLVIGTGDAQASTIATWAKSLGDARKDTGAQDVPTVEKRKQWDTRRVEIIDKPDRTQTQIYLGQIGVRMTDSDFFPLYLANHAFGGGSFSARLMVEVRVKRGWSYGASSYFKHGTQPRSWATYLFPAAKDTPNALALVLKMIDDFKAKGITPEEFDFAQRSLVNSAGFMYNTPKKRVENKLLERTLNLPDGFMKTYGPELKKVTLAQANDSVKGFLKPEKLSILVLGTAKDLKDPIAKATGVAAEKIEVVPYTAE